ncbi:acyl-CoA dehydratase activase-related protein, partial [Chlamydiota bacterium]
FEIFSNIEIYNKKSNLVIGIPKILNLWLYAPFYIAYLQGIGIQSKNILWSSFTNNKFWKKAHKLNSADLCFPGKYALSHVMELCTMKRKVDVILNPCIIDLFSEIKNYEASFACAIASGNPEVVKASFSKEENIFNMHKIRYLDPSFHMDNLELFNDELYKFFKNIIKIRKKYHNLAFSQAKLIYDKFRNDMQQKALEVMKKITLEGRLGIVFLSRPYHYDPGLNHGIPESLQELGYPVFTIDSLPRDPELLNVLFKKDLEDGSISNPLDISDVWKYSASGNTNQKVWAAKFVARHPNLAAVEFVSFRCGHDATILKVIENIMHSSNTPFFTFHDMDQTKPSGSIKLRIETIDYFLKEHKKNILRTY